MVRIDSKEDSKGDWQPSGINVPHLPPTVHSYLAPPFSFTWDDLYYRITISFVCRIGGQDVEGERAVSYVHNEASSPQVTNLRARDTGTAAKPTLDITWDVRDMSWLQARGVTGGSVSVFEHGDTPLTSAELTTSQMSGGVAILEWGDIGDMRAITAAVTTYGSVKSEPAKITHDRIQNYRGEIGEVDVFDNRRESFTVKFTVDESIGPKHLPTRDAYVVQFLNPESGFWVQAEAEREGRNAEGHVLYTATSNLTDGIASPLRVLIREYNGYAFLRILNSAVF